MLAPAGLVVRKPLAWADAIVVMAGSEAYEERATVAASLFREGRAPVIVLTDEGTRAGWSEAEQRNPSFAELTVVTLVRKGVTSDAIVTLPVPPPQHSTRTVDEALQVVSWSRRQGSYNLLVVTSGCHTRRT
ncbi:MAG: YdcF family protein [Vicinamibacterales bacterium]